MLETDVISHLIDIESQAADILVEAQEKADKQISEAKQKADEQVLQENAKLVSECEANFEQEKSLVDTQKAQEMAEYQEKLKSLKQDKRKFNTLMNKLFLGSVNG